MGYAQRVKHLLGTHAVLWITEDAPRLSARVRALAKSNHADSFGLAAVTLLEIARLIKAGTIIPTASPAAWLDNIAHRFQVLPLTPTIAWGSGSLEWTHRDPADRLICATALAHKLTLITNDKEITHWGGVPVLW